VHLNAAGTFRIDIASLSGSGGYKVQAALNAMLDDEAYGGTRHDNISNALDISGSFVSLGAGANRGAVLATADGATNIAQGRTVSLVGGSVSGVALNSLTDGLFNARGAHWQSNTVWWSGTTPTLQINLGGQFTIDAAKVQADNNDAYLLEYLDDADGAWKTLWNVPNYGDRGIPGMITRPDFPTTDAIEWAALTSPVMTGWVRFRALSGDNSYSVSEIQLRGQSAGGTNADCFAFDLTAGQSASVSVTGLSGGNFALELQDATGVPVALGAPVGTNVAASIQPFIPAETGRYYARVVGDAGKAYSLLITRNSIFNLDPSFDAAHAIDMSIASGALGALGNNLFSLPGTLVTGPLVLTGTTLKLGINRDGSFITGSGGTGIVFSGVEFVTPGTPQASFTIARNGQNFQNNSPAGGSATTVTTENLSTGGLHGARMIGTVGGNLRMERVVVFNDGDEFATIATRLTNLSNSTMTGVAWLENMDPDQGSSLGLGPNTFNDVVPGNDFVRAHITNATYPGGLTIGLGSADARAVVSAEGFNVSNPFDVINSPLDPNGASGDIAINLAFNFGSLAPGESVDASMLVVLGRSRTDADNTYFARADSQTQVARVDYYSLSAHEGDVLHLTTSTPGGGSGEPQNVVDPSLELYGPSGVLVASDANGAGDGRNALIDYTVPAGAGGLYNVGVRAATTRGEYTLSVTGATGAPTAFTATGTTPANGALLAGFPATYRVDFSHSVLLSSVAAGDLTVDGIPASFVNVIDHNTLEFGIASANHGDGLYDAVIAAGALTSISGLPLEPFAATFDSDLTNPVVVESSVAEGQSLPLGGLVYQVRFSEELAASGLGAEDVALVNTERGITYTPSSFAYD
ncbi:MAG: hypothetical protein ACKV0T_02055, partial [Planctomycetales bacterium]